MGSCFMIRTERPKAAVRIPAAKKPAPDRVDENAACGQIAVLATKKSAGPK